MTSTNNLNSPIALLLKLLLLYLGIIVFAGLLKAHMIVDIIPVDLQTTAKISSYVSVFISSLFSIIVIGVMIAIVYFTNIILEFEINEKILLSQFENFILIFILFELLKFLLIFLLLKEEVTQLQFSSEFIEDIKRTSWFNFDTLLTYLMIIVSSSVYIYDLKTKANINKTIPLILIFIILTTGYFISTIEIMGESY